MIVDEAGQTSVDHRLLDRFEHVHELEARLVVLCHDSGPVGDPSGHRRHVDPCYDCPQVVAPESTSTTLTTV